MDPNETLRRIREYTGNPNYPVAIDEAWDNLIELVDALDQWITRGGFLPSEWMSLDYEDDL